ncbi:MAG: hypothetical protein AAF242_00630 [Bacteroidota bacterium]
MIMLFMGLSFWVNTDTKDPISTTDVVPNIEVLQETAGFARQSGRLYYQDTLFSGYLTTYYSNGQLKSKTGYTQGMRQGGDLGWYPDGSLLQIRYYHLGQKVGIHTGYWPTGNYKYRFHFEEDLHHGAAQEWYPNGCLYTSYQYQNGKEDGPQQSWNPDGSFKANFVTIDGHRYGLIGLKKCGKPE